MSFEAGQVINRTTHSTLFSEAVKPHGLLARARGLLGRSPLTADQAWWFDNCSSVHMFGMMFPIDVIYLNRQKRVIKLVENLKPFTASACWGADVAIEVAAGSIEATELEPDQVLEFVL